MEETSKNLVLVRHGVANSFGPSDHQRDLTAAGRRDAVAAGAWLHSQRLIADRALVSDALRTRETWAELAHAAGYGCPVDRSAALYAAEVDSALDLVRATGDEVDTLVVVGHNPTIALLAQLLDDGEGDPDATSGMSMGFPTTSIAVLAVNGSWTSLDFGAARLRAFHVARAD